MASFINYLMEGWIWNGSGMHLIQRVLWNAIIVFGVDRLCVVTLGKGELLPRPYLGLVGQTWTLPSVSLLVQIFEVFVDFQHL